MKKFLFLGLFSISTVCFGFYSFDNVFPGCTIRWSVDEKKLYRISEFIIDLDRRGNHVAKVKAPTMSIPCSELPLTPGEHTLYIITYGTENGQQVMPSEYIREFTYFDEPLPVEPLPEIDSFGFDYPPPKGK